MGPQRHWAELSPSSSQAPPERLTLKPHPQPEAGSGVSRLSPTAACAEKLDAAESPHTCWGGGAWGPSQLDTFPGKRSPGAGGLSVQRALGEGRPRVMSADSWQPVSGQ